METDRKRGRERRRQIDRGVGIKGDRQTEGGGRERQADRQRDRVE